MPVHTFTNWNSRASDQEIQIEPFRKYYFICEGANTETFGITAQFTARILLASYSVILPENHWQYTKYSRKFSDNLTKILTAQSAHQNCAV